MGVPANVDRFSIHGVDVANAMQDMSADGGPWSCPKETEQVILPLHSMTVPVTASAATPSRVRATQVTPAGRFAPPAACAPVNAGTASKPCALHLARLERENLRLRAELERCRSKDRENVRRKLKELEAEDREQIRCRLRELETEVREHWCGRVAELEAEVASLKFALRAVDGAKATASLGSATAGRAGERFRASVPLVVPAAAPVTPGALMASSFRHVGPAKPDAGEPWRFPGQPQPLGRWRGESQEPERCSPSSSTEKWPKSSSSSGPSSCHSSPRAKRPPPTRVPPPQASPVRLASGALTSRGDARSKAAVSPGRCSVNRPRSRSLPGLGVGEVSDARPIGFLEAFGGFYKQLMQGTKCTGPDALAVDERFEIDLSAEFPPERREAQVDLLAPLQAPLAFERILERSVSAEAFDSSPMCNTVHHL